MKILNAISNTSNGGAENIAINQMIDFKHLGNEVSLLINYRVNTQVYEKAINANIRIIELKNHRILNKTSNNKVLNFIYHLLIEKYRTINDIFAPFKIKRILKKEKFDVVHMHLDANKYLTHCITNEKIVYTCHSDIDRYITMYGEKWLESLKELSNKGLTIVALNHQMKNRIKELIPNANVVYIPNGIDFESYKKRSYDKESFKAKIGIDNDGFIIGHIGRLHEVKNHEKSFSILKQLITNRGDNYYLFVVGGGREEYTNYLKQKVVEMSIEKNVFFLGDMRDVIEIISILDAAILPSKFEGFPLTALELQSKNIRSIFSMATPEEAICNDNCFRLDINESDEKWANLLLSNNKEKHNHNLSEFEKDKVLEQIILLYNK